MSVPEVNQTQAAVSIAGLGVWTMRLAADDRTVLYLNRAFARFLEIERAQAVGQPLDRLHHVIPSELFTDLRQATPGEREVRIAAGALARVLRCRITAGPGYADVVITDVTAEERFRDYVQRYVSADLAELDEEELRSFRFPERRFMTVAFSDLRGFTALSETLSPEAVRAVVNDYLNEAVAAVDAAGGSVDKIVGDEIMALFGAPRYYPDHVWRAIGACTDAMRRHEALRRDYQAFGETMPACGTGLNVGDMVLGNIGGAGRQNYTVMGAPVNLASRLCSIAAPGEILITENTLSAALDELPAGWNHRRRRDVPVALADRLLSGKGEGLDALPEELDGVVVEVGPANAPPQYRFRYLYRTKVKGVAERFPVLAVERAEEVTAMDLPLAPSVPKPAERLFGRYTLLSVLGTGAMGEVWKARDNFGNFAAIKLLRSGDFASEEQKARFKREGEAMARVTHRHACRILEVGEYEGVAFIAMEYVDGASLADVLAVATEGSAGLQAALARVRAGEVKPAPSATPGGGATVPLPLPQALALVGEVCVAIEAAHAAGVFHRDLKPANILLRTDGEAVVTDFGLAKMRDDATGLSMAGTVVGTVEYMAPEQADGSHEPDERTDVYGIGATLYRLVTGHPHFPTTGNLLDDLARLRTWEPLSPRKILRKLDPDLEVIILKALRCDPAARYRSAAALREDLERFKRGEVILARPATLRDVVGKLVKRNRVLVTTAGVATLLLLATGGAFSWVNYRQKVRAQKAQSEAEKLVTFMVTDLKNKLEPVGKIGLLGDVNRRVEDYYGALGEEGQQSDTLRNRVNTLVNRTALLGAGGDAAEALVSAQAAVSIARSLAAREPAKPANEAVLYESLAALADQEYASGNSDAASAARREALAVARANHAKSSENASSGQRVLRALNGLGDLLVFRNQLPEALADFQESERLADELLRIDPNNRDLGHDRAIARLKVGEVLLSQGDQQGAIATYDKAIGELRSLLDRDRDNARFDMSLTIALIKKATAESARKRFDEARPLLDEASVRREALTKRDPQNQAWLRSAGIAAEELGVLLYNSGRLPESLPYFQRSADVSAQLAALNPNHTDWQRDVSVGYQQLGTLKFELGDPTGALDYFQRSFAIADTLARKDPANLSWQRDLAISHLDLGRTYLALKRSGEARAELDEAIRMHNALIANDPSNEQMKTERQEMLDVRAKLDDEPLR